MQFGEPQAHAAEPSLVPEDSCPGGHSVAIRNINRAHELMTQLQAVLLQFPTGFTWSQLGGDIIKEILKLTTSALSALQSGGGLSGEKRKAAAASTTSGRKDHKPDGKKKRREQETWALATTVPYEDGHQWRKYGQKSINNAEHPKSYFRCTYKEEQGCEAKKTVQQEDVHADPPKFSVEYTGRHTCKISESAGLPFQKPSPPPTSDLTSSSVSSSPSLAAATGAKVDDQSPEKGFLDGDLDLLPACPQVHDEILANFDSELDNLFRQTTPLPLPDMFGDDFMNGAWCSETWRDSSPNQLPVSCHVPYFFNLEG